jgi:hypothetical protein
MEKTTKFELPDFSEKKKRGPKPSKVIEKHLLASVNREVKCAYCGEIKILNPNQYQKRFDFFGSEDAIPKYFKCQPCETLENTNPIRFWFIHGSIVNEVANNLKTVFEDFIEGRINVNDLQIRNADILDANNISKENRELLVENGKPEGFKFNFPFVGTVEIHPMDFRIEKKIRIIS